MTDSRCDPRLVRVSVGIEGWRDLKRGLSVGVSFLIVVGTLPYGLADCLIG